MATHMERPVCGLCRIIHHPRLDDEWHEGPFTDGERDREYVYLCADCYPVVVEDEPETRDWILEEYPIAG
jgi:hypothetical protein